jgi:hypothetical protein
MTPPVDGTGAERRQARSARRLERSQRHLGDRGGGWSPSIQGSAPWTDAAERDYYLDREVEALRQALEQHGEMGRRELGRAVHCRTWGPGRFAGALRAAVARGAIERTGLGRYGPARGA